MSNSQDRLVGPRRENILASRRRSVRKGYNREGIEDFVQRKDFFLRLRHTKHYARERADNSAQRFKNCLTSSIEPGQFFLETARRFDFTLGLDFFEMPSTCPTSV